MTTSPAAPEIDLALDLAIVKRPDIDVVYVSGPMTGRPQFNYPAFRSCAAAFRAADYTVYDPTERIAECGVPLDTSDMDGTERLSPEVFDLRKAFAEYAAFITTQADAIVVLPGWEDSKGAVGEVMLARAIGLPVIDGLTGEIIEVDVTATAFDPESRFETASRIDSPDLDDSVARHPGNGTETISQTLARVARPALHAVAPASAPTSTSAATPTAPSSGGEIRTVSATGGAKGAKEAQFSLIPPGPLKELAVLYGRGNIKYPPEPGEIANWMRGYDWSLSYDALRRHLDLWWSREEDHDPEMGVKHLINVAWHAFNLAWFMENRPEFDNRPPAADNNGDALGYSGALPFPQYLTDILEKRAEEERRLAVAAHQEQQEAEAGTADGE